MIHFFGNPSQKVFALSTNKELNSEDISKLTWLFGNAELIAEKEIKGYLIGPRATMISPWSTNATEITQNMGIEGIIRIEEYFAVAQDFEDFDPMLSQKFSKLDQTLFTIDIEPEAILEIEDIHAYNLQEGLSLSEEEVNYLEGVSKRIGRKLTDAEVFGFSQVNSEHCRHKIFNGTFVIDGEEKPSSLFKLIKKTT
ncbi:MAG: hypothetical protein RIR51_747, partial [Bacteroidota bacterium]